MQLLYDGDGYYPKYEERLNNFFIVSCSNYIHDQEIDETPLTATSTDFYGLPQTPECHVSFTQYDDSPYFNIRMNNVKIVPNWYDAYEGLPKWLKWVNKKLSTQAKEGR